MPSALGTKARQRAAAMTDYEIPTVPAIPGQALATPEAPQPPLAAWVAAQSPDTPPDSPHAETLKDVFVSTRIVDGGADPHSALHQSTSLVIRNPAVYGVTGRQLHSALLQAASRPLAPAAAVFPWAHGLASNNSAQCEYFAAPPHLRLPPVEHAGQMIMLVHVGPNAARIAGAVDPGEILPDPLQRPLPSTPLPTPFLDKRPAVGVDLRAFGLQTSLFAQLADIVVYAANSNDDDDDAAAADAEEIRSQMVAVATRIANAQATFYAQHRDRMPRKMQTFILQDSFSRFHAAYPEDVVTQERCFHPLQHPRPGERARPVPFCLTECAEMRDNTECSRLSENVTLGNEANASEGARSRVFDVAFWCAGPEFRATFPRASGLRRLAATLDRGRVPVTMVLPSISALAEGGISLSSERIDEVVTLCSFIYATSHGCTLDPSMGRTVGARAASKPYRILMYCMDGYSETSFYALAYLVYSEGIRVDDAWIKLHSGLGRAFYTGLIEKEVLSGPLEKALLRVGALHRLAGDVAAADSVAASVLSRPLHSWFSRDESVFDGSLPSRITEQMYLGNLTHSGNPALLRTLGITHVLSVGQNAPGFGPDSGIRHRLVADVQDDGVDSLLPVLQECFEFIDAAEDEGGRVLVHCRVGVSRSASVCIAHVMRTQGMCLPSAYLFVRARRLNIIIQPNLRFMYDLLRFEEMLSMRHGEQSVESHDSEWEDVRSFGLRHMEWPQLAREIAAINIFH